MPGPFPYAPIQYTEQQTMLFPGMERIGVRDLWQIKSRLPLDFASGTNKASVSFWMGAAIARDPSGSGFILANNSTLATTAIGLACLGAPSGKPEIVQLQGLFSLDDWTPVTGTTSLQALAFYWVDSTNGKLTSAAPASPLTATLVGFAISSKTLRIGIEQLAALGVSSGVGSVISFGAKGDGAILTDVTANNGSAVITSPSGPFTKADIGKSFTLYLGIYQGTITGDVNSGNVLVQNMTTTVGLTVGMAVGGYGVPVGATIALIVSPTSLNLSAPANATKVGVTIGFTPPYLLTTIHSYQGPTQVTLSANSTFSGTNLRGIYGTDNTTAIQNAINSISTLGGIVNFPAGLFIVAGSLQDAGARNAVLVVPKTSATIITIRFQGTGGAGSGQNGFLGKPSPETGTIIFCPTIGSGTNPCIIGGSTAGAGNVTGVNVEAYDITFRTPKNPSLSCISVLNGGGLATNNVLCDTDYAKEADGTLPATLTPALIGPNFNNGGVFRITNTEVDNYGIGILCSLHASIVDSQISQCRKAIDILTTGIALYGVHFVANQIDICNDSTQLVAVLGFDCEFEDYVTASPILTTATISDKGDQISGTITGFITGQKQGNTGSIPVGYTGTDLVLILTDNTGASLSTTAYNAFKYKQRNYFDWVVQALVLNDTTGFQFNTSTGNLLGYLVGSEQFNAWIFQTGPGMVGYFRNSNGDGMRVDSSGVGYFNIGVGTAPHAAPTNVTVGVTAVDKWLTVYDQTTGIAYYVPGWTNH